MTVITPTNDDGSRSAVSSIQNFSSVSKSKVSTNFSSNVNIDKKDEIISLSPDDVPLRTEGKLPNLPNLESFTVFFGPFMVTVMDLSLTFKEDNTMFEIDEVEELADFILKMHL